MPKKVLAITTCRVSSTEQLQNNSLERQRAAVLSAAQALGASIPEDGQWSGSVSSKAGTNINRKDLKEMLDYCRKHPAVKYLIVHEVDRFMRSIKELFYFEVLFEQLGVTVWYASQPELNDSDYKAKLLKAFEAFKGEGSNVERQIKSIDGNAAALKAGRYPFSPKPGYRRGYEKGIQEIHPVRGPALQKVLVRLASRLITPAQALVELNNSDFMSGHSQYKMDKFRKIVTDPFYAGILDIDKQIKVRNENGLHEPLITKDQHLELLKIMDAKKKNQAGPRKNGNPKYPCNNIVECDLCLDKRNGRVVGFDHGNGKPNSKIWEKYRCRSCGRYIYRDTLHSQIEEQFKKHPISSAGLDDLMEALNIVWKQREGEKEQEVARIRHRISNLNETIQNQVEEAINPANADIKQEIMQAIARRKLEVSELEEQLDGLRTVAEEDKERFLRFAFGFAQSMGSHFLDISQENRLRCKQIMFPAGFRLDANKKVYTPEVSTLITLQAKKKDAEASDNSHLVRVRGL